MYNPEAIRALIFDKDDLAGEEDILEGELIMDSRFYILLIRRGIGKGRGWKEIGVSEIKSSFSKLSQDSSRIVKGQEKALVDVADFMVCGAPEGYWRESEVNILGKGIGEAVKGLESIQMETRIEALVNEFGSTETGVACGYFSTTPKTEIFRFSTPRQDFMLILSTTMEEEGESEGNIDYSRSLFTAVTLTCNMLSRWLKADKTHSSCEKKLGKDVSWAMKKALAMRKEVFKILHSESETSEEDTLKDAAVYFAKITDHIYDVNSILSYISVLRSEINNATANIHDMTDLEGAEVYSLKIAIDTDMENIHGTIDQKKQSLLNSESSMHNSLELLKTYLESEQRMSAARSTRALGLLSLIFAAFGITDTISNFYIYYLDNQSLPALQETLAGFGITMIWPVFFLYFAYYFYLKRKW